MNEQQQCLKQTSTVVKLSKVNSSLDLGKANDGQCLKLVSFSASNYSAVVLTLLDRTLVHRNVDTHLQLSILRQIWGK